MIKSIKNWYERKQREKRIDERNRMEYDHWVSLAEYPMKYYKRLTKGIHVFKSPTEDIIVKVLFNKYRNKLVFQARTSFGLEEVESSVIINGLTPESKSEFYEILYNNHVKGYYP